MDTGQEEQRWTLPTRSELARRVEKLEEKTDKLQDSMDDMRGFQKWVLGAFAAIAGLAGVFASNLKKLFNLP